MRLWISGHDTRNRWFPISSGGSIYIHIVILFAKYPSKTQLMFKNCLKMILLATVKKKKSGLKTEKMHQIITIPTEFNIETRKLKDFSRRIRFCYRIWLFISLFDDLWLFFDLYFSMIFHIFLYLFNRFQTLLSHDRTIKP